DLLRTRPHRLLGPFRFRDVVGDTLEEERVTAVVAHDTRLAPHPDDLPNTCERPELGAERTAAARPARELQMAELAIVGMELAGPQQRVAHPRLLRVAEEHLERRADVELAYVVVERRHERHGGDLLDQGPVARLRLPAVARLLVARESGRAAAV